MLCIVAVLAAVLWAGFGPVMRDPTHAFEFSWLLSAAAVLLAIVFGPWRTPLRLPD